MSKLILGLFVLAVWVPARATIIVGPWMPLFKGIDHARGQMLPDGIDPRMQVVNALRIDLSDPDIRLFPTPRCTNCLLDTITTTPSRFLAEHELQAVINCSFFHPNTFDLGVAVDVLGLAITEGRVVSPSANPATNNTVLLFTSANQPVFIPHDVPPTNTAGIYTAVSGNRPILVGGANLEDPFSLDLDPRTALGISQDGRFLYAVVIDGRQPGYSDNCTYYEAAEWLLRFGAYHGLNADGGSSSTIAVEGHDGQPVHLNRNSYIYQVKRAERADGHLLGIRAQPHPFIRDVSVSSGASTVAILWTTDAPSGTRVEYGLTPMHGESSEPHALPVTRHVVTLSGLLPDTNHFFRIVSAAGGTNFTRVGQFRTASTRAFDLTHAWRYTTNNLDGVDWRAPEFDDSHWLGPAPGLFYVETNPNVAPRNTLLPTGTGGALAPTYYFRTHFPFTGITAGVSLMLSNHIDDGAVFHLNGVELGRLRMPPAPASITYATYATGYACSNLPVAFAGDACTNCPDLLALPAYSNTNLRSGDNVLAVEVHNNSPAGTDLVFGAALFYSRPYCEPIVLQGLRSENVVTLFWNGAGLVLQQADELDSPPDWTDVPGPVTNSPYVIPDPGSIRYFRLRR